MLSKLPTRYILKPAYTSIANTTISKLEKKRSTSKLLENKKKFTNIINKIKLSNTSSHDVTYEGSQDPSHIEIKFVPLKQQPYLNKINIKDSLSELFKQQKKVLEEKLILLNQSLPPNIDKCIEDFTSTLIQEINSQAMQEKLEEDISTPPSKNNFTCNLVASIIGNSIHKNILIDKSIDLSVFQKIEPEYTKIYEQEGYIVDTNPINEQYAFNIHQDAENLDANILELINEFLNEVVDGILKIISSLSLNISKIKRWLRAVLNIN